MSKHFPPAPTASAIDPCPTIIQIVGRPGTGSLPRVRGWSGGAMVLGKLPVPGRPTSLDKSRARACCSCNRCGWGLFGHFYSHLSFLSSFSSLLSPSLCETARYRLKYCLKGPLNPKQPTKYSITRAYCACSRCGWGGLDIFFLTSITSLLFLPLFGRRPDID